MGHRREVSRNGACRGEWWLGGEAHIGRPYGWSRRRSPLDGTDSAWTWILGVVGSFALGVLASGTSTREKSAPVEHLERSTIMEQERSLAPRRYEDDDGGVGVLTVMIAFGMGLAAGAAAGLLTTPEAGTIVRRRLQRGAETARRAFDEALADSKESWGSVGNEARQAMKRTTARLKEAAQVTKDAVLKEDGPRPIGPGASTVVEK